MTCEELVAEHARIMRWQQRYRWLRRVQRWSLVVYLPLLALIFLNWWWTWGATMLVLNVLALAMEPLRDYIDRAKERFIEASAEHAREHLTRDFLERHPKAAEALRLLN